MKKLKKSNSFGEAAGAGAATGAAIGAAIGATEAAGVLVVGETPLLGLADHNSTVGPMVGADKEDGGDLESF